MDTIKKILLERALSVLPHAYAPYSDFHVAAALQCADGSVFTGVNVENAAYGDTICAERSALCAAITAGNKSFRRMLIIVGKEAQITDFCPPCGSCRQVMREWCDDDFEIILYDAETFETHTLGELLPRSFLL